MADITPVGLCIATQELFDARRFRQNFADNVLLRMKDRGIEDIVMPFKRELISDMSEKKFLHGHKAVIASNIDKILSLSSRYASINATAVGTIIRDGKELMKKVLFAETFEEIANLESTFKSKINLPMYSLFLEYSKVHKLV